MHESVDAGTPLQPDDLDKPIARGLECGGFIAHGRIAPDLFEKEQNDEKRYQHFLQRRMVRGWVPATVDWLESKPANDGVTWDWEGMKGAKP